MFCTIIWTGLWCLYNKTANIKIHQQVRKGLKIVLTGSATNIPSGRRWGWVEYCYVRFQRVEEPSGCVRVQRGAESERIYSPPEPHSVVKWLLLIGRVTRETGHIHGCVSSTSVNAAENQTQLTSMSEDACPAVHSRGCGTYKTVLCCTFKRRNWSPGTFNPLRLATGATGTPITEGRNVQKEAETLQLDCKDNRNKEELSFGKK